MTVTTVVLKLTKILTVKQGIWLTWRHNPIMRWGEDSRETSQPDDHAWWASTFVPVSVLYDLLETGPWDSDFGGSYHIYDHYVQNALLDNGYLNQRSNGAIYANDKLKDLCKELGIS